MIKKYTDFIASFAFLLIAFALYVGTFQMKSEEVIGPEFLPSIIALLMAVFSVIHFITSYNKFKKMETKTSTKNENIEARDQKESPASVPSLLDRNKLLFSMILILVYAVLLKPLGFWAVSTLYLFLQISIMAPKRNIKNESIYFLTAIVSSTIIYFFFANVLQLILPTGIFG